MATKSSKNSDLPVPINHGVLDGRLRRLNEGRRVTVINETAKNSCQNETKFKHHLYCTFLLGGCWFEV